MRTVSLLSFISVLVIATPAWAQPSASTVAQSQNVGLVETIDSRRYKGRRPHHRPHYSFGYYGPHYPPPYYSYAYPYPYPYPYPYYAPYYGPRAGVSLSFGF